LNPPGSPVAQTLPPKRPHALMTFCPLRLSLPPP
jgi:hypothetical protein